MFHAISIGKHSLFKNSCSHTPIQWYIRVVRQWNRNRPPGTRVRGRWPPSLHQVRRCPERRECCLSCWLFRTLHGRGVRLCRTVREGGRGHVTVMWSGCDVTGCWQGDRQGVERERSISASVNHNSQLPILLEVWFPYTHTTYHTFSIPISLLRYFFFSQIDRRLHWYTERCQVGSSE